MSYGPTSDEDKELVEYEELDADDNVISKGACPRYIVRYMREQKGMRIRVKGEDE